MEALKKIEELRKKITSWEHAYYALDNPIVSDEEYDGAMLELIRLEEKHPEFKTQTSPTMRVGGEVLDVFTKKSHSKQMLSLGNAFNSDDISKFNKNIIKAIGREEDVEYVVEPKIDGLSVCLVYEHGQLQYALTRGNGIIGEDITHNIKTIRTIPLEIEYKNKLEIRGEVYLSKKVFDKLNRQQEDLGLPKFANPRNAAAGALRQLDSKIAASRGLSAFMYYLPYSQEMGFKTHYESIEFARKLGFPVASITQKVSGVSGLFDSIKKLTSLRDSLDYEIDGIVLKLNNLSYYEDIGYTAKAPKWAIAYKFPAEVAHTTLEDIFSTVGRTGRITYNAKLSAVRLAGTVVQYATLHNAEYVENLDIRIGDTVKVKKAGDIIPKVLGPVIEHRDGTQNIWVRHKLCPKCGSQLEQVPGEIDQYCINEECDEKQIQKIIYFASRTGMEITGLGPAVVEKFFEKGIIKNIVDLYTLEDKKEEITSLDSYGEKSFQNLIDSINKSKARELDRFICALGIRHVGSKVAKILAKEFKNIEALIQAKYHQLEQIDELGDISANTIVDFFGNEKNCNLIAQLQSLGVEMKYTTHEVITNSKWDNKKIVITGTLSKSRDYFKNWLESRGATISSSVSKKTDYVLAGENAGSKYDKAIKLGVSVIREEDLDA